MSLNDPIGDLITRIRNAQMRHKTKVSSPGSKLRESVLEDVRQGYVSVERARSDYGVVVRHADEGLKVDIAKTQVLRGKK